ncbi:NUDIX hydrolase [Breznakiella homolactica]|uniref:NUDIX domain-containing protein n=1 Tax=Breznakiella homolactica TaxID=2798577 RepID=A0A7T7XPB0_9SPIR|nr:NUDIX domain-containing protein [Breznakiella homolactica]QQO10030.1 NUDIX domain-containing protein [Breznakiella homolactica]
MKERFSIPAAGGIIVTEKNGEEYILIQDRVKNDFEAEKGLIEIPAGKVREYENIYDCLRREIFEETGLTVAKIDGEAQSAVIEKNGYKVLSYETYSNAQNLEGYYPVIVQIFLCTVQNGWSVQKESDESKNIRWIKKRELKKLLENKEMFYPMHIGTLEKYCGTGDHKKEIRSGK